MHHYHSAIISLTQCMLCMLYVASCTALAKMNVSFTDGLTENDERMKSYVEVQLGTCSIMIQEKRCQWVFVNVY